MILSYGVETASSVDLRLLGPLEATGPGGALRLSGGRQRALLALLALRAPAVGSRAQLVDALWGTEPPPTAVKTLHSHLARVRQAMAPAGLGRLLVTAEPGYALRLPPGTLDIDRFTEHLRAGRAALREGDAAGAATRLRAGVALWRGDPLADCPVAEWGQAEVDRLRETGIDAAEALAEADLARGELTAAVDALERLVGRHPLRERPWELLMIAHHRAGRQAEALRTYRRARAVLVAELGVEPGAELRRLEAAVLAGAAEVDPVTASPALVYADVPPQPGLVGRHRELAEVRQLIGRARLVTLTGPGGCGKTRLATTAFPAATVVDLTPVTDPGLVVDAVATALGVPERPGTARLDTVVEALSGDRLVVLDNCEHLVRACGDLVVRLLAACQGLAVLATSREALRVADEVVYEVPPLAVPDPDVPRTLCELAVYDSVRLFLDRAAEQGVREFGDGDTTAIARLCAALDGLPLAIELAAARTPVLTPAQIVRRLRDRFGLLTYGVADGPAHHRTLRATLAWSHDSLTAAEAALFGRLAVFAGGFTVEAAEAVGGTLDALTGLVGKSLVRRQGNTGRFTMLETVAAYAAECLAADDPARGGHAEYFLALAEEADAEPSGERLRELRADHDNLRAAMAWFAGLPDPAGEVRLAAALCRYCHLHGHYREGRQWLAHALARADDGEALAKALAGAASLALFECDYAEAVDHATAALERANDPRLVGRLRRLLGSVARERASYPEALRWYTASRESFRAAGDLFGVAYSHQLAGATAWLAGDLDTAGAHLAVSLTRLRELDDSKGAASCLAYLGAVAHHRADPGTARRLLDEALDVFGHLEFKEGIAWALNLLGVVEHAEGRHDRAAGLLRTSLAHHRELGDRWRQASVLEACAAVACATGEPDRAAWLLHQAEDIRTTIGAPVPLVERAAVAATYEAVGRVLPPTIVGGVESS